MKPKIISMIKVNGEWINQDDISPGAARKIIEKTIRQAASNIGFEIVVEKTKETA